MQKGIEIFHVNLYYSLFINQRYFEHKKTIITKTHANNRSWSKS